MGQTLKLSGLGCFKRVDFPTIEYQLTLTRRDTWLSCLSRFTAWVSFWLSLFGNLMDLVNIPPNMKQVIETAKEGFEKALIIQKLINVNAVYRTL